MVELGKNHREATMRTPLLSVLAFALLTSNAVAAEPQKLWEARGFKQPESVVFDRAAGAIYVSNVNGDAMKKDGNGFISKLGPDGKVVAIEWVKGLDSPTGLAIANGKLYAADVDRIAEIDIAKGEYEAPGSKFLNDLTADKTGSRQRFAAKGAQPRSDAGRCQRPGEDWPRVAHCSSRRLRRLPRLG